MIKMQYDENTIIIIELFILEMTTGYNLKWEKFGRNIAHAQSYKQLRLQDDFHDVTLVSDDLQKVSAHKLVLSACSQYFKTILTDGKHQHPMLCLDGIDSQQLNNVLDYIYNGEIEISHEHLRKFLQIAQKLKLDGLIPKYHNIFEIHLLVHLYFLGFNSCILNIYSLISCSVFQNVHAQYFKMFMLCT